MSKIIDDILKDPLGHPTFGPLIALGAALLGTWALFETLA